jgi:hypothetical protein
MILVHTAVKASFTIDKAILDQSQRSNYVVVANSSGFFIGLKTHK